MKQFFARIGKALHYFAGRMKYFFTRLSEHSYRFFHKRGGRVWMTMFCTACLFGTIYWVFSEVNLVYVTDSGGESKVLLVQNEQADAEDIVAMSGLEVGKYDEYFYTAYSGNHAVLTVQRAYPVCVRVDGDEENAYLNGGTVEDALGQLGVTLGEEDYTEPSLHTPFAQGDTVTVHRVTYTDTMVESAVPYTTRYRYTSLLSRYPGRSYTLQSGRDGVQETVYRERRVDGEVVSSEQIDQYLTADPVEEVILAYGAGAPVSELAGPEGVEVVNNAPSSYQYVLSGAVCTGYSSETGRGASQLGLYAGTVAVDPRKIPYGSLLYITSSDGSFVYGWAIATDTGAALQEGIIDVDLFYDTYLESVLNGKKALNVYVVA